MSNFGIRTFDDQGRDTLHMVSSFLMDVLTLTGSGSKTYAIPAGGELFLASMHGLATNTSIYCAGNTLTWNLSTSSQTVMIICRSR